MSNESLAQRHTSRDSLMLSADIIVVGAATATAVRVRNLSAGGMMVDSDAGFFEGALIMAKLRGLGEISGRIAWVAEGRAGIAFDEDIDPKDARSPAKGPPPNPLFKPQIQRSRRPGLKLR